MAKKVYAGSTKSSNTSSVINKGLTQTTNNSKSFTKSHVSKDLQKQADYYKNHKYESQYGNQINGLVDKIGSRKFEFDMNTDALYQQYAQQYKMLGNQAMQDTMANATALSGGYNNSYAQTAGQQAYNSYLQQLNEIVPDIYAQERSNYDSETNELYNQASLLQGLDDSAYNRFINDRDFITGRLDAEWNKNAVTYTQQKEKTQTSNSQYTSNSSVSVNYTPKQAASLQLPSTTELGEATSGYKKAKSLCTAYGIDSTGLVSRSNWDGTYNGQKYKTYEVYLADFLSDAVDRAYTQRTRKNANNTRG